MNIISKVIAFYHLVISKLQSLDFVPLLLLRLYLAPVFIISGLNKLNSFKDNVDWFGNTLGMPFPTLMVSLVIFAELVGGLALVAGLFTRAFSFILSITMAVAALTVHWENGWFAITSTNPSTSPASLFAKMGFASGQASLENSAEAAVRLNKARELLQTNGNYEWLTETGNFVILNNGIEFSATYFIMLLVLFIYGAGRWVSLDYWLTPKQYKQAAK